MKSANRTTKPIAPESLSKRLLEGEEDLWDQAVAAADASDDEDVDAIVTFIAEVLNGGVDQFIHNCMHQSDDAWMLAITFLQRVTKGEYDDAEVSACAQLLQHMRAISTEVEEFQGIDDDETFRRVGDGPFAPLEKFLYNSANHDPIYRAIIKMAGVAQPVPNAEGGRSHWSVDAGNIS